MHRGIMSETLRNEITEKPKLDSFDYEKILQAREQIFNMIPSALEGHNRLISLTNGGRFNQSCISEEDLAAEVDKWLTMDKLDFIKTTQEFNPDIGYQLIASPNVSINRLDFHRLSQTFSIKHNLKLMSDMADYSPSQLGGNDRNRIKPNKIKLLLIPSCMTTKVEGDIYDQKKSFENYQKEIPFLTLPSPLQFLAYLETLYALEPSTMQKKNSLIASPHIDLPYANIGTKKNPQYSSAISFLEGDRLHQLQVPVTNPIYTKRLRVAIGDCLSL